MSSTAFGSSFSSTGSVDITNRYSFDNGQRLQFYDVGRIILKPNQAKPTGPIRITFDYFTHSTTGDYFSVNSYTDISYKDIPSATLNGKVFNLRDCLDFRPRIGDDSTFSVTSAVINEFVDQESDFQTDYSYYLPKTDKLVIDRSGNISIISGVSSTSPREPSTPENAMALYVFRQAPYVRNVDVDINVTEIDNRRYTMRDIGRIESRVKNLEYYTSLNLLETQTATLQVQDSLGFDRFKNGFVVDNFSGHGIGDVSNPDYSVSIDYNKREVRPSVNQMFKQLFETTITDAGKTSNNYVRVNDLIMPVYTSEALVTNSTASRSEFVNPYNIVTFKGTMTLSPSADSWFDTLQLPVIAENNYGNYDSLLSFSQVRNAYESVYGNWRDLWYGNERNATKEVFDGGATKTNTIRTSDIILNNSGNRYEIMETLDTTVSGDRVISRVVLPKLRDADIGFTVKGMKPNTRLYAFFDDVDVTRFTRISFERANVIATINGDTVGNVLIFNDLITDQYGSLEGKLGYSSSELKLTAGDKIFRLTDSQTNEDNKTTFAEAIYSGTGQLVISNKVISTRPVNDNRAASGITNATYPPSSTSDGDSGDVPVVNLGLSALDSRYNNDRLQDTFANELEKQGFEAADITSLTSDSGLNGSIQADDYFDRNGTQFNYNKFLDDAGTDSGIMSTALAAAGTYGNNVIDHFKEIGRAHV